MRLGRTSWIALCAVLVAEGAILAAPAVWHAPLDLRVYFWGGQHVTGDAALYDLHAEGMWFTYPPFSATLFWPFAHIPAALGRALWMALSVGTLVVVCDRTLRLARRPATARTVALLTAAAFVLAPVRHTLQEGQINLLLAALVLIDVERLARDEHAGVGIGIATAVKLVPGVFILWLLLARRTRAALTAATTFAACAVVGLAIAPRGSLRYWLHLSHDTGRVGATYISNQSPFALAGRLAGGAQHVAGWYPVIPLALGAIGLPLAAAAARRGEWLEGVTIAAVTGLLVSPISWAHHWVWIVPALVVLWQRGGAWRTAVAPTAALFVIAPMWFTPMHGGPSEYGFHGVITLVANCYLVAAVVFLTATAISSASNARTGTRSGRIRRVTPTRWFRAAST